MTDFKSLTTDLSSEHGYRYEFRCQKCGRSRKSALIPKQQQQTGPGKGFLTRIFGGGAASAAAKPEQEQVPSSAREEAIAVAMSEFRPHFSHCEGCDSWVCIESCWDATGKSCPSCKMVAQEPRVLKQEPKLEPKSQLAQPQPTQKQAEPQLQLQPQTQPQPQAPVLPPLNKTTCYHCGGRVDKGRLCAKCGNPLEVAAKKCVRCPHVVPAGSKWCPKCGTSQQPR